MEDDSFQGIAKLTNLVNLYQSALARLQKRLKVKNKLDRKLHKLKLSNEIIAILHLRDEIEQLKGLPENQKATDLYHDIVIEDIKLKKLSDSIATSLNFTEFRDLIRPSVELWWWYPVHPLNRLDPLLGVISVACLIAALALAIDLIPRFFAGGPNLWGGLAVIATPMASWFFGKEALEKIPQGKAFIEKATARSVPSEWQQEVILMLSFIFVVIMSTIYCSRVQVANSYYCLALGQVRGRTIGEIEYEKLSKQKNCNSSWKSILPKLTTAKSKLDVAVAMNPSDPDIHYFLGRIYELRQDLELAKAEYKTAMDSGSQTARIRMGLLYLLDEQEKSAHSAIAILMQAEDFEKEEDKESRKSLYTLRAWARYSQARYQNSETDLAYAESLFKEIKSDYEVKDEAPPALFHCIRAAVLEKQKKYSDIDYFWNECKKNSNQNSLEGDFWRTKYYKCATPENKESRKKKQSMCLEEAKKDKDKDK
jgi:hypothetical protein